MKNKKVETLLKKIEAVKTNLNQVKDMRPGSVTRQLRKRGEKKWECWQISYTFNRQSKTEYVRDQYLEQIKNEVLEYKRFRTLVDKLVELNINLSKERIEILKQNKKN